MNILFISHNPPTGGKHFGGTEHLFKEISNNLPSTEINFFTMTPKISTKNITWQIRNSMGLVWNLKQQRVESEPYFFGSPEYSNWISEFLISNNINVVHVFHHMWTPLSTLPIAQNLGIKSILSIHDFSHICDSFNLLDEYSSYCRILEAKNSNKCSSCVKKRGSDLNRLTLLRAAYFKIFQKIDTVTVGTVFSKKHLVDFYNLESAKIQIIPPNVRVITSSKLKVARSILILGNFTIPKGATLSLELMKNLDLKDFSFTQAGRIDPEFRSELKELAMSRKNVLVLGQYSLGEIPDISASIAFFGSIWPETFCIAASEALEMGLKVVVPEIGAFIDRFKGVDNAFFYSPSDVASAVESILIAENTAYKDSKDNEYTLYPTAILELYSNSEPHRFDSRITHSEFNSWGTSNLKLLGFKVTDSNLRKSLYPNLFIVFRERSRAVGTVQALTDAYYFLRRKLK